MTRTTRRMMTVGALAIIVSIAAISIADAQPRRGRVRDGLPPQKAEMRQEAAEKVNLSDAQKEKLAAIREDTQRQQVLRHGKMADIQAQIRVEFMNDNLDKDKIRGLHREMSTLKAAAADARLEARLATRDVFTPEQREQLKQMRRDAPRNGMHSRHGRMQGRGGRGMGQGSCAPGMGQGMGQGPGKCKGPGMGQDPGAGMSCKPGCCAGQGGNHPGFAPMGPGPWWMDDDDAPAPPAPPDNEE